MSEEETTEAKNKKVNKMSMLEVEAAIKKTEEKMAGLTSKYALALMARKEELSNS